MGSLRLLMESSSCYGPRPAEWKPRDESVAQGRACDLCYAFEEQNPDPIVEFLLDDRTRYKDECCTDYLFFLAQHHTLFALCCAHPLHPFKPHYRFVVLLANLSFSFLVAGIGGYLEHIREHSLSDLTTWLVGPVLIWLLTSMLHEFAVCGMVQRKGTKRIYRWCCEAFGWVLFLVSWIALVPSCIVLGLFFSSFKSSDDYFKKDFKDVLQDWAPQWHVFVSQWWLQQAAIEWGAEPLLIACRFFYSRPLEEGSLVEERESWAAGEGLVLRAQNANVMD